MLDVLELADRSFVIDDDPELDHFYVTECRGQCAPCTAPYVLPPEPPAKREVEGSPFWKLPFWPVKHVRPRKPYSPPAAPPPPPPKVEPNYADPMPYLTIGEWSVQASELDKKRFLSWVADLPPGKIFRVKDNEPCAIDMVTGEVEYMRSNARPGSA